MIPRIKSFGTKLLILLVLVVAVAQLATWRIVSRFNFAQARTLVDQELQRSALTFRRVVDDRRQLLASVALAAARDYEIKQLFASDDPATLASGLDSLQLASKADIVLAIALDGSVMASTSASTPASDVFPSLVAEADANPAPNPTATGFG